VQPPKGHLTQPTTKELVMTANGRISQFAPLKQPTSNYLSQIDSLVKNLHKLKDKLTEVLFHIETNACDCRRALDEGDMPLATLKELPSGYAKEFYFLEWMIIALLKHKKILNAHYKAYSLALTEWEVAHG
jgi:hypothetical protein